MYSYSEDGTVTMRIMGEHNFTMFDRQVFGLNPDDIEECDLPASDEMLGTVLTEEGDIEAYGEMVRAELGKSEVQK